MADASLRALTTKTTFLVGFALASRTSEVQGLAGSVCFGRRGTSAVLTFDDRFWLKTEDAQRQVKRDLVIPALSQITDDRDELLICPVRALKYYCERVERLKADRSRLFVAPSDIQRPISKNALAYLWKDLIRDSHSKSNLPKDEVLRAIEGFQPRDIRAYSSSLSYIETNSLEHIRNAGLWNSNTMFPSHYLRDTADRYFKDGIYRLRPPPGPVVAAQAIVPARNSGPSGAAPGVDSSSPSGTRERKDKRSKVKSSRGKTS